MASILVVDHAVVREGVKMILSVEAKYPQIEIDEVESGPEAALLLKKKAYDLVILDIGLANTEPFAFIQSLLTSFPKLKILVFSLYPENIYGKRVLAMGVKGFLDKRETPPVIRKAILGVLNGDIYMTEDLRQEISSGFMSTNALDDIDALSDRELEVLLMLLDGVRLKDISKKLQLQMSTVSTYKKRIYEKLRVNNTIELMKKSMMYGLVGQV